jgi:hypothetical protein
MMTPLQIGVYRAQDRPECWLEVTMVDLMQRLMDAARAVAGHQPDQPVYLLDQPQAGTLGRRVGEIAVRDVTDTSIYAVQEIHGGDDIPAATLDLVGRADLRRAPHGPPGSWVVQCLVFDRRQHNLGVARQWIAQQSALYVDLGAEEDKDFYRFPQYDPRWFKYFSTVAIAPGISAVYGQVTAALDAEHATAQDAMAKADRAVATYAQLHRVTQRICARGLAVVKVAEAEAEATEERYILGIVLEPTLLADGTMHPDTQGDVYTEQTVRDAAHRWLSAYGHIDLAHNWRPLREGQVQVLESYLAPAEFTLGDQTVRKGTWLLALRILDDALWAAVKAGQLGAYSIGGTGVSTPLEEPT